MNPVNDDDYQRIAQVIKSADSPVGIDAEKTHVMILHKLERIEERLARLEALAAGSGVTSRDAGNRRRSP